MPKNKKTKATVPNAKTREAIREARRGNLTHYKSVEEMIEKAPRPAKDESKEPNAASREAIEELEKGGGTVYESVEALFKKFRP
jgi:hypothetical protein